MSKSNRSLSRARGLARKVAMQLLYQWQLTQQSADELITQYLGGEELQGADLEYFSELVRECIAQKDSLNADIASYADRPIEQLDPVEHAILFIGLYELNARLDVPYKVAINEAVELAKRFGATDGHRYINAMLDKAAADKRRAER